jgi:hypothetical protein
MAPALSLPAVSRTRVLQGVAAVILLRACWRAGRWVWRVLTSVDETVVVRHNCVPPEDWKPAAAQTATLELVRRHHPELVDLVESGKLIAVQPAALLSDALDAARASGSPPPALTEEQVSDVLGSPALQACLSDRPPPLLFMLGTVHVSKQSATEVERVMRVRVCLCVCVCVCVCHWDTCACATADSEKGSDLTKRQKMQQPTCQCDGSAAVVAGAAAAAAILWGGVLHAHDDAVYAVWLMHAPSTPMLHEEEPLVHAISLVYARLLCRPCSRRLCAPRWCCWSCARHGCRPSSSTHTRTPCMTWSPAATSSRLLLVFVTEGCCRLCARPLSVVTTARSRRC